MCGKHTFTVAWCVLPLDNFSAFSDCTCSVAFASSSHIGELLDKGKKTPKDALFSCPFTRLVSQGDSRNTSTSTQPNEMVKGELSTWLFAIVHIRESSSVMVWFLLFLVYVCRIEQHYTRVCVEVTQNATLFGEVNWNTKVYSFGSKHKRICWMNRFRVINNFNQNTYMSSNRKILMKNRNIK